MSLKINIEEKQNYFEVTPVGEIDIYTSPEFKDIVMNIIDNKESSIVINGEELEYMDSTGLGVLMSLLNRIKETNLDIKIINLKPNIYKIFDITGLNNVFNIE